MGSLLVKARMLVARMFGRGDAVERAQARHQARVIHRANARRARRIGTQAPPNRGTFTSGGPGGIV